MSKPKDEDLLNSQNDPKQNPAGSTAPGGSNSDPKKDRSGLLTIEEHQKNLNIDAPVFAAVIQTKGWGSGKKVPEAVFKKTVEDFLGAPMGGN